MPDNSTTTVLPLERIAVDEGRNPRALVDEKALAELVRSIGEHGILQPVLVEPTEEGYRLVAGYRRVRAAREAGLSEIPVLVREPGEDRLTFALSENLPGLREEMDPVSEAQAIERIAQTRSMSQRKLAAHLGKSEAFVRERLRLVRLPEAVRERIAAGKVPTGAAGRLEEIAKVSERLAEEVAGAIAEERFDAQTLSERPGEALRCVLAPYEQRQEPPEPGEIPAVEVGGRIDVASELPATPEQREELVAKLGEFRDATWGWTAVSLRESDVDALRALGVLVEFDPSTEWGRPFAFCTDDEALRDRVRLAIDAEGKAARRQRREEERAQREAIAERGGEASDLSAEELVSEARRVEREEREAEKEAARSANLELGHRLLRRRGRKVAAKRQLARAKALARLVIRGEDAIGAGIRLTREPWQEVEVKTFKNGASREKVTHLDCQDAAERLLAEIDRGGSVEEVLDVMAEALVAAEYASERELPQSRRTFALGLRHSDAEVDAAIVAEAKGVVPEALAKDA